MKLITGSSGQINELLKGVPNNEYLGMNVVNGKTSILLKSDVTPIVAGEVKTIEVEVIKEVIKEVPFDNPELLEQIQTLQDALSDALNAEEKAKREAEDLKKQLPKLKAQVAKLKKAIAED